MSETIFLSTVTPEFGPLRGRLARFLHRTKTVHVRHQDDFVKRGVSTLCELAEEIEASELVLHEIGANTGSFAKVAGVDELLEKHPGLKSQFPDIVDDARKEQVSYTQWEAWLALFFGKRLCCYDLIDNPNAGDDEKTKDSQAAQRRHRDRLKNHSPAVYSKPVASEDELFDEMLVTLIELGLITEQHARQPIHLPYRPLGDLFKGRAADLDDLNDSLGDLVHGRPTAIVGKTVHGLGGVGKTRLAVEYAWRNIDRYSALLFVVADSPSNLRQQLAALTAPDVLNLPEHAATEEDARAAAAIRWLASHPGWLLILDNVDDEDSAAVVEDLLTRLQGGHVLVTSRRSDWGDDVRPLELSALAIDEAAEFLLQRTSRGRKPQDSDAADATALAEALGGLALALEQAGAYIARLRKTLAEYLQLWRQHDGTVQQWPPERRTKYRTSVAATWQATLDQLDPAAVELLNILAWFAPEPIPVFIFENHIENFEQSLASLADFSMVGWESDMVTVHCVVQEVLRCAQEDSDHRLTQVLNLLDEARPEEIANDVRTWPVWDLIRPHVAFATTAAETCEIHKPTSKLMGGLGTFLSGKALHSEAEDLKRRALALDEQNFGPDSTQVALRLNNLATTLQATNRLSEAEPLMRRALAIDEQSFGSEHPRVAAQLNNLAQLLKDTNRLSEAEPLMRRALAIDEQSFGSEHPEVAIRLNNLAQLLQDTNRLFAAEPLYRRALAIDEQSFGTEHPNVAIRLNNLALLLKVTNRLSEAEPLYRRALAIDEQSFGSEHPKVAIRLNNLSQLLQATNRLSEAEPLMRRALAIDEQSFGSEHPNVALSLWVLAVLLRDTDRLDQAVPLMERAKEIYQQFALANGYEHPHWNGFESFYHQMR